MRIQFDAVYELARAGRKVTSGMCVGAISPGSAFSDRLRDVGVSVELFERGMETGHEQAVDQALQVHMLRSLADLAPGIAVLLTGDGAGEHEGRGYLADLKRMYRGGWDVEVISWRDACHGGLMAWAKEVGYFVALDDFYESVTFIEKVRMSKKLGRQHRPSRSVPYSTTPDSTKAADLALVGGK